MGHVRMTTHSDAPIERVFELVLDAKRLPEWNTSFNEIKDISGPFDRIGTTAEVVMKVWGRPITGRIEVTDVVRPTLLTVVGSAPGGGKMTWTQRFTPAGTGTDAEMEIDYELPAGFLGAMADKLFVEQAIERDARHSAENFKALAEATTPVPACASFHPGGLVARLIRGGPRATRPRLFRGTVSRLATPAARLPRDDDAGELGTGGPPGCDSTGWPGHHSGR